MKKIYALAACLLLIYGQADAQLTVNVAGAVHTQDFNTLVSSGNGTWSNNTTLTGFYTRTSATSSISACNANTGSTTAAGLYSYGSSGNADRALGYQTTNSFTGSSGTGLNFIGWRIRNNTGGNVVSFTLTYTGEQWRKDNTSAQKLTVDYQTGSMVTDLIAGTWTDVPALDFTSPVITNGAAALDGNAATNRVAGITATVTLSSPLANGNEIMIRWSDLNDSGNDHVLAIDDASITLNAAPMPIRLISFEAKKLAEKVRLSWATATEINNELFSIERSANGQEFEVIATVDGAGNSNTVLNYISVDEKPARGVNYYRLRQTDHNGTSTLSKTIAVDVEGRSLEIISLKKNDQYLNIEVMAPVSTETTVMMYDMQGRIVSQTTLQLSSGYNQVELATQQALNGIYLLKLSNTDMAVSKKFLF